MRGRPIVGSWAPGALMVLAAVVLAGAVALAVVVATSTPRLGVRLSPEGGGALITAVDAKGPSRALEPGSRLVALEAGGRTLALTAEDLADDPDEIKTYAGLDRFYAAQDRLVAVMSNGPATLHIQPPGAPARSLEVQPAPTHVSDLPHDFWLQLVIAGVALIIGAWVWALRPKDLATRLFGLAGLGLMITVVATASYDTRELALPARALSRMLALSAVGAWLLGGTLVSLFLTYPVRIVKPWVLILVGALAILALCTRLLRLAPNPILSAQLPGVLAMVGLLAAIGFQWRASRRDPLNRVIIRWLGVSVGVGCGAYVAMVNAPLLFGAKPVGQAWPMLSFLLIYGGAAIGIARFRLFELEAWAFRLLFFLGGAALLLACDAVLALWVGLSAAPAFSLSLLVIGLLYLPIRDWVWRWLTRKRRLERDAMFRAVALAAYGEDDQVRAERWLALLRSLFDPLDWTPSLEPVGEPALSAEGMELRLPAFAASPPLTLRGPWSGRGLFSRDDLVLAREILSLLSSIEAARAAYDRGVLAERQRIAGDLHDDVGARLLSALHSADDNTRPSLHAALEDIRAIVAGLSGERRPLGRVIAELRHETVRRLEALGIALDWPLDEAEDITPLSYREYKNLSSALREVVSNIIRHARASAVTVQILNQDGRLQLTVTDDGVGLAPDPGGREGSGLRNLARRLADLDGEIAFPPRERGVSIRMAFPLTPHKQGEWESLDPA